MVFLPMGSLHFLGGDAYPELLEAMFPDMSSQRFTVADTTTALNPRSVLVSAAG
jgi:hypothetical protein